LGDRQSADKFVTKSATLPGELKQTRQRKPSLKDIDLSRGSQSGIFLKN
jgi:hypothetical protein